ncbi:RNA pseudouridine synthase 4, mitochondrial-like [Dorcoceras hygrometricum]|uniref:RNA pseudouridine synthase 4, mitochondrial-like n=1 Tax=Dorcoceras hygrometricum TaxID=472368 RepID=A0A2Z7BFK8_9LAMI|nr:RNA pseudouridine synthase 4, mitochondrial-like [Dorcoceras hygrometricum]
MVAGRVLHRPILRRLRLSTDVACLRGTLTAVICQHQYLSSTALAADGEKSGQEGEGKWLILPPFTRFADGSEIGKLISRKNDSASSSTTTALKWILTCCPHLPRSLVQKLFRLRQVRRESSNDQIATNRPARIGAKELMDTGDRIFLPKSVGDGKHPSRIEEKQSSYNDEDSKSVRGLELYKDHAIIVINKPPGMPVQSGPGINRSLDALASKYLRYDYEESPRLVHRLDRDCSGILVMGRTKLTASILHSIFREKTFGASNDTRNLVVNRKKTLQKRYCALVIGSPRRQGGLISTPLGKVVVDNGRSERITVVDNTNTLSAQHAVTEYQVVASSSSGYTWLELYPHTGRKHQLRVHCAEVLGTPIVGDYKYGWQAHKKLKHIHASTSDCRWEENISKNLNLELEKAGVSNKTLPLHLHCKEMVLPNISLVLENGNMISGFDAERVDHIKIDAPLPPHMQRIWDLLINS